MVSDDRWEKHAALATHHPIAHTEPLNAVARLKITKQLCTHKTKSLSFIICRLHSFALQAPRRRSVVSETRREKKQRETMWKQLCVGKITLFYGFWSTLSGCVIHVLIIFSGPSAVAPFEYYTFSWYVSVFRREMRPNVNCWRLVGVWYLYLLTIHMQNVPVFITCDPLQAQHLLTVRKTIIRYKIYIIFWHCVILLLME